MKTLLAILGFQAVNNATKNDSWIFLFVMIVLLAIVIVAAILIFLDKKEEL